MFNERQMVVTCKTEEVLRILHDNRNQHKKMVKEAREGYLKKAEAHLKDKLEQIRSGKITGLRFYLSVPEDHTSDYNTAVKMLEMHVDDNIELDSVNVRRFIEDKWDWAGAFYTTNSAYSASTMTKGEEDGYL